jgi:hypothetical protein
MNDRLDQDRDNAALAEIRKLQGDLAELKSRQSIGRALVKMTYVSQTANSVDLSAYSIPANTIHYFYIFFTGDGSQAEPYGSHYSQIYNNGTAPANRLSDYQQKDGSGTFYFTYPNSQYRNVNGMSWAIGVSAGASGASISIKMRTMTTCKGVSLAMSF